MAEPFLGQIMMVGWNFAARGWAFCDGQILPISQNTALFSLLGTTFGGDGRSTYGLPDMRGRVPVQPGRGPGLRERRWGERSGTETTTLSMLNMPPHSHPATTVLHADEGEANVPSPEGAKLASTSSSTYIANGADPVNMAANAATTTVGTEGGGQPFNNMQPYLCVYFEIAMVGIYPSRS